MRKIVATFMLLALALPGATRVARAAGTCDFSSRLKEFALNQADTTLTERQKFRAEVNIRQSLLNAAIACDQQEIAGLKEALGRMPDDVKALPIYAKLTGELADAAHYYDEQERAVPRTGLSGTRSIAHSMADWRSSTYVPLVTLADDLILWADNQDILNRAAERMDQADRLALSLKIVNQGKVADKLEEGKKSFGNASSENDKARDALNAGDAAQALLHIKASLEELANAYHVFLELQSALEKIVK